MRFCPDSTPLRNRSPVLDFFGLARARPKKSSTGLRLRKGVESGQNLMAICYYTCNLLPTSLLGDHGHIPKRLADTLEAREPAAERQTHLCHPMTCPYVVRTLSAAGSRASSVSARRLGMCPWSPSKLVGSRLHV